MLPPALSALLPQRKGAHVVLVVTKHERPAAPSSATSAAVSQASQKKFKKTKRPSSVSVIAEADQQATVTASSQATDCVHTVQIVLLDPEVSIEDELEAQARLVSLGSVRIDGQHVVVSENGIATSYGEPGVLQACRPVLLLGARNL